MDQSPKDGVRLAKRSFLILGIVYVIFAVSSLVPSLALINFLTLPLQMVLVGKIPFYSNPMMPYALLLAGAVLLIATYFLVKRNIIGVYLGWFFILAWGVIIFFNNILLNIIPLIILLSVVYANYKAHKTLQNAEMNYPTAKLSG